MHSDRLLDQIVIPVPCPASWAGMEGDEHVRFCRTCQRQVYNLSAMTADDALALIRENEGKLCGRLYRRRDGSVVTADCRTAFDRPWLQFSLRSVLLLMTAFAAIFGFGRLIAFRPKPCIAGEIWAPPAALDPTATSGRVVVEKDASVENTE